jgi:uncharacterized protein YrzB (UPF0473 family)
MNENTPDLYTLQDDEGNEMEFQLLDQMEVDGIMYYGMVSTDVIGDDGELVVLKEDTSSDEEGMLITIDDEEELDRIGGIFLERIQKMFDEDSDDDSEE